MKKQNDIKQRHKDFVEFKEAFLYFWKRKPTDMEQECWFDGYNSAQGKTGNAWRKLIK